MGCNYYARIIPSRERKDELCNLIQNSMDFRKIKELINETYGRPDWPDYETEIVKAGEIHLGKSSYGWKFLWNPNLYEIRQGHMEYDEKNDPEHHHGQYMTDPSKAFGFYGLTKKGLKKFIDREDVLIYDEYGELQDKEEFWNFALSKDLDKNGNEAWDGKLYEEHCKKEDPNYKSYSSYSEYCKFLSQWFKIEYPYNDFYSDGLRFATTTEFS